MEFSEKVMECTECGNRLKHRDYVKRIMKSGGGVVHWVTVQRLICCGCGQIHRHLPEDLKPYKHYRADIINDVINGAVTSEDITYEDYPCEMTMFRWKESYHKLAL